MLCRTHPSVCPYRVEEQCVVSFSVCTCCFSSSSGSKATLICISNLCSKEFAYSASCSVFIICFYWLRYLFQRRISSKHKFLSSKFNKRVFGRYNYSVIKFKNKVNVSIPLNHRNDRYAPHRLVQGVSCNSTLGRSARMSSLRTGG